MKKILLFFTIKILILFFLGENEASADDVNLDKVTVNSQNPLSNLIHTPFQNNFNFGFDHRDQPQLLTNIQPIIPLNLNQDVKLVFRPILPVLYQVDIRKPKDHVFGLGDFNPELYFTTVKDSKIMWGLGSAFLLPTATTKQLGSEAWGAGPAAAFVVMPSHWVLGALIKNVWSFAKNQKNSKVNLCTLQPFVYYNFPHHWYIVSAPTMTAAWNSPSSNRWVVPLGAGVGHVFKISEQTMSISLQSYYNVLTSKAMGPTWLTRLTVDFLFPK